MSIFLYNLVIRLYAFLIHISSLNNVKARQWVQGRKDWKKKLRVQLDALKGKPRIWIHCASYGEFEQGRPLLEAIREKHPQYHLVLSFFSPSGYEAFKNWPGADLVTYLPFDSKKNATGFIELVQPKAAIFIKYEFWLNFLFGLKNAQVPTYLVSAVFKPHHPFFRWYGKKFIESLSCYTGIFVQDAESYRRMKDLGVNQAMITGDTRFDRVVQIRENFSPLPFFEEFCKDKKVIVAGSTWPGDDDLLLRGFQLLRRKECRLILVPHEVGETGIRKLREKVREFGFTESIYSEVSGDTKPSTNEVLIVDQMGLLSRIYHYANVTYVGGGFNEGLHNCLEPAVHLKPVLFYGDSYHKFNEVLELMQIHAVQRVQNAEELRRFIAGLLDDAAGLMELKKALQLYFDSRSGSTQKVLAEISKRLV